MDMLLLLASVIVSVSSPDGSKAIELRSEPLSVAVACGGNVVADGGEIALTVDGKRLDAGEPRVTRGTRAGRLATPVYRKSSVDLAANEATADFGDWAVRLVARNDGVAYRLELRRDGRARIDAETAAFTLPGEAICRANMTFAYGIEETVAETLRADEIRTGDWRFLHLPFVYTVRGRTVAVTDCDVRDYPVGYLGCTRTADGKVRFDARFSPWPEKTVHSEGWGEGERILPAGGRFVKVLEYGRHLVDAEGPRTLPWRCFALADEPSGLCENDLVRALSPATEDDFSWVRPGKVAWDWWNDWNLEGVGFKPGCNTRTYEYYIDFAAKNGIEYVILDEGWSAALDIWRPNPDVDVPHLIGYAAKRGVGIVLWMAWAQVVGEEEKVAAHFARMGAKGFKVDFMDRGDAEVQRFLERFARACAHERMLVDYHGATHPTGLEALYPNIVNYEGVFGLEQMKSYRSQNILANDVKIVFGRLTAGPADYTPGAMRNYPLGRYGGDNHAPGSLGTRARQMAMTVLYFAPLQMLCDSPTQYEANRECLDFMASVPVVWDDVKALGGTPESHVALARRKGDAWYAAGIAGNDEATASFGTDFLGDGTWRAEIFRDADGSRTEPTEYVHERRNVPAGERLMVKMTRGGGFVIRFMRQ